VELRFNQSAAWYPHEKEWGCVMVRHREHTVFAAIVMAVIGGITAQMMRADAVRLAPMPPVAVKIAPFG